MTKVFITGATGQVGSHLVHLIASKLELGINSPRDVLCLVRRGRGSWEEKTRFLKNLGVTIVEGTLTNKKVLDNAFKNNPDIEYVFHTAANISPAATYRELYKANVIGTRYMLEEFAKSPNGKSFIFCSSISVYETFMTKERVTIVNEDTPLGSLKEGEPYPITKRKCELMMQDYANQYKNKSFIITRIGAVVGARDRQIIPSLVTFLSMKFIPKLISFGRDYFAIAAPLDIARAQVFLAKRGLEISGETYNLANKPATYREIFEIISEYYGMPPPLISIPLLFFNLVKPILPWVRRMFPNNAFIQTALSPSAIEFIGKSFIFKTDKIEELGFSFMVSAEETIKASLRDAYPTQFILDSPKPTDDKEGSIRSLLELDQNLTKIEMKAAEQVLEERRKKNKNISSRLKDNIDQEIKIIEQKLRKATAIARRARRSAKRIRSMEERAIKSAKLREEHAIRIAKAEMNLKISNAHKEFDRTSIISKNKIKRAEYVYKNAITAKKKAESKLKELNESKNGNLDDRFKEIL